MHTLKKGYTFLAFFLIITIIFFVGTALMRSYALKNTIVQQQYYYWQNYYRYEGCLEFIIAYFLSNDGIMPLSLGVQQGDTPYMITIHHQSFDHKALLNGEIVCDDKAVASWELFLKKESEKWHIKKRTVTPKTLD